MNSYEITEEAIIFECGCSFRRNGKTVVFNPDLHDPNHTIIFECPATYELLQKGLTEGIFQLGSPLGKQWCKKLLPTEMEHISALGALLRPGCLESKDENNNSITVRYERKKNGKMGLTTYHPVVDEILSSTYGENIYQEESLDLAKRCAGFTLVEADLLRKGIGKKIPEIIAQCKKDFMEKGKTFGVLTEEQLGEVFGWIEASQRYSFNHSHAWSYGLNGYVTAYQKTHFPVNFYKAWFANEDKRENYANFVSEAKIFDINIYPPDIRDFRPDFYIKKKHIYFGLSNIKGLVKKDIKTINEKMDELRWSFAELGKSIPWLGFLANVLETVSSKTAEVLIRSGALDCFSLARATMLYEYERWNELSPTEKKSLGNHASLTELVQTIVKNYEGRYEEKLLEYQEKVAKREASTRKRSKEPKALAKPKENQRLKKVRQILKDLTSPLYNIKEDTIDSIIFAEEDLLGVALTKHKTDEVANCAETATCKDILDGRKGYNVLRVKVESCREYKCKNGATMAFVEVSDRTGRLSIVAFSDAYNEYQHLLTRGSVCFISGSLDKESFLVKRVYNVG